MLSDTKVLNSALRKIVGRFETVESRSVPNLSSSLARPLWTAQTVERPVAVAPLGLRRPFASRRDFLLSPFF